MSKYLDEYVVGERFVSSARTVTESDVVNFACMTGDMHPNHTDAAAMEHSFSEKELPMDAGLELGARLFVSSGFDYRKRHCVSCN